jgi:hypothetical protein
MAHIPAVALQVAGPVVRLVNRWVTRRFGAVPERSRSSG